MNYETSVRMGEIAVSSDPGVVLSALGLGSCIGICAYDPIEIISGMAHIVLPASMGKMESCLAKSADVGVPNLIEEMKKKGAVEKRIKIAIAGGARIFSFNNDSGMDIGARNIEAVKEHLRTLNMRIVAEDVGGTVGRTVKLHVSSGLVTIRMAGKDEKHLTVLSGRSLHVEENIEACLDNRRLSLHKKAA